MPPSLSRTSSVSGVRVSPRCSRATSRSTMNSWTRGARTPLMASSSSCKNPMVMSVLERLATDSGAGEQRDAALAQPLGHAFGPGLEEALVQLHEAAVRPEVAHLGDLGEQVDEVREPLRQLGE